MIDEVVIAKACYDVNKTYCESIGDFSQPGWDYAPDWQKESVINGVRAHVVDPNMPASGSHESWMKEKQDNGWVYGDFKDPEKKEHPCIVPFEELPKEQQMKDHLFKAVVNSLADLLPDSEAVDSAPGHGVPGGA